MIFGGRTLSNLDAAIRFCGLYEAELLVSLMLRYWNHPLAADDDLVKYLVEAAAEALSRSRNGEQLIEDIPPENMNFVAAVWYAEFCQAADSHGVHVEGRRDWLATIRRAVPSCFCDPDDLI